MPSGDPQERHGETMEHPHSYITLLLLFPPMIVASFASQLEKGHAQVLITVTADGSSPAHHEDCLCVSYGPCFIFVVACHAAGPRSNPRVPSFTFNAVHRGVFILFVGR